MSPLLPVDPLAVTVEGVTVRFGGVPAVDAVTLSAPPASVTGLVGPNGAGKTTLFDVIAGQRRPTSGRVRLGARDVTRLPAAARARLGLGRTFQRLELFPSLTVRDNVLVAAEAAGGHAPRQDAEQALARLGLGPVAGTPAAVLPTGLARTVELARALVQRPRALLLDEPASGLDGDETAVLAALLRELADEGLAVLVVEHDADLVEAACDLVHVLEAGRLVATTSPGTLRRDDAVRTTRSGPVRATR